MKYVVKNLITAIEDNEVDIVVHQANCHHTMGAGVASELANKYPAVLVADLKTKKGDKEKLGKYSYTILENGTYVFNLYSQFDYFSFDDRLTSYDALYDGLRQIFNIYAIKNVAGGKVGLPKIGAGLARGNWEIIEFLIKKLEKEILTPRGMEVIIYVLNVHEIPNS